MAVEKTEVLSPEDHQRVEKELHRLGKISAKELTPKERVNFTQTLEEPESDATLN